MTNEFLLVRHATCERMDEMLLGRTVDSPLDARGMQQAAAMARALSSHRELLIVASPRRRAHSSAPNASPEHEAGPEVVAWIQDETVLGRPVRGALDLGGRQPSGPHRPRRWLTPGNPSACRAARHTRLPALRRDRQHTCLGSDRTSTPSICPASGRGRFS